MVCNLLPKVEEFSYQVSLQVTAGVAIGGSLLAAGVLVVICVTPCISHQQEFLLLTSPRETGDVFVQGT
jgi:hypothetical protein